MSTSFPGALDDFTNPSGSQSLAAGGHSQLHADLNDAVEALEAKVGADASAVTTSHDYLLAQLSGNLLLGAGEISITGTATATIGRMHVLSGTATDYLVSLPTPAGNAGKLIGFRTSPLLTKLVTLSGTGEPGTGTGSIDHAVNRTMWANGEETEAAILICDGADWFKIAGKSIPMVCRVRLSASQSISNATITPVNIDSVDLDPTGAMSSVANKITIIRAGRYKVIAGVRFENLSATATRLEGFVSLNGNHSGLQFAFAEFHAESGSYPFTPGVEVVQLEYLDYLQLCAFQNSGVSQNAYGHATNQAASLTVEEIPTW